jgi:uncharacterized protein YdaU (DUF1376 family)
MGKLGHPPAFLFYPDDFSSDGKVEAMSTEQVGAYMLLLCKSWREKPPGSLPSDDSLLAKWARVSSDRWSEIRLGVLAAFTFGPDSRWHQKRQRAEYDKLMAFRRGRSKAAKSRWDKEKHARALHEQYIPSSIPSSIKDQNQNPAANQAAVSLKPKRSRGPEQQKQNIEARDYRLLKEQEARREIMIGAGPVTNTSLREISALAKAKAM